MRTAAAYLVGLAILLLPPADAGARRVEDTFAGQIVLIKRQPPPKFRSNASFRRFLKQNRIKVAWPPKKGSSLWRLRFMAFFKRPLRDLEVKIRFYDVTAGHKFVAGDSIYTSRGQRILSSSIELEKPTFRVGRKYKMYLLTARNAVLASTRFRLGGKVETYSGKVTFSEDEAR